MTITKFRWRNKYVLLGCISLTIAMLISWIFASHFFEILTMDYTAPDLDQTLSKIQMQKNFLQTILTWEGFVDSSMYHIIDFFPILIVLPMLAFFDEYQLFKNFGKQRLEDVNRYVVKSITSYAGITAIANCFSLTVLYSVAGLFMSRTLDDIGGYASALPDNFYAKSPYLFFLFMIWTIYFVSFFVLSFLAGTLVYYCNRKWKILVVIMLVCFSSGLLSNLLHLPLINYYSTFLTFNTVYSTTASFLPIVPFSCIALFLLVGQLRRTEKST